MKKRKLPNLPVWGSLLLLALGLLLIIFPEDTLSAFPPLLGGALVIKGLIILLYSFITSPPKQTAELPISLYSGSIDLIIGLVFLFKQDLSLTFLSVLFGLYIIINAFVSLSIAWQARQQKRKWRQTHSTKFRNKGH